MSGIDYLKFKQLIHSDDLYHHGIKGQKWGVRKKVDEQEYERMTPDEKLKYMEDRAKQSKKNSRRVRIMLAAGAIITYALIRQYKKDHPKATTPAVEEKAKEVVKEKVKEQTKEKVKEQAKEKAKAQVTNSVVNVGQTAVNKILKDGSNNLTKIPFMAIRGDKVKPFIFMHSLDNQDNILEHFGILGQKWGVRRFQNEDGTLTDAGKERYYKDIIKNGDMKKVQNAIMENKDIKDCFLDSAEKYEKYIKAKTNLYKNVDEKLNAIAYDDKYNYENLPPYDNNPKLWDDVEQKWATEIYNKYLEIVKNTNIEKMYKDFKESENEYFDSLDDLENKIVGSDRIFKASGTPGLVTSLLKFNGEIMRLQSLVKKIDDSTPEPTIDYASYEEAKKYDPISFIRVYTFYQFVD